jgi:protein-tyrosine phosphatase
VKAYWVATRLAFGSAVTTRGHAEQLKAHGVTHVINLRHGKHNKHVRCFKSLWLPFKDDLKPRPAWFYRRALTFYSNALSKPGTKVLVMCHHGVCRSASLAYFLLRASGHGFKQAANTVRKARRAARIARGYRDSCEAFLIRNDLGW